MPIALNVCDDCLKKINGHKTLHPYYCADCRVERNRLAAKRYRDKKKMYKYG